MVMIRWHVASWFLVAVLLCFGCSSAKDGEGHTEAETEQSVSVAAFTQPITADEAGQLLRSLEIQPLELVVSSADNSIQAGYILRESDTLDSALESFRSEHERFLSSMQEKLEWEAENAPMDEADASRSMREKLMDNVHSSKEELRTKGLLIKRLRLNQKDVSTLRAAANIQDEESPDTEPPAEDAESAGILRPQSLYHETWAPCAGTSDVSHDNTYQRFYFNNVTQFALNSASTYEHETQVYDQFFANFTGYWSSNLPCAYYDTSFEDDIDNFTVGSACATYLTTYSWYYTYMGLTDEWSSTATVRIKGQIGHRFPSSCYSTWCIWADATTGSMAVFTAPAALSWQY